ncbi:ATP-binding protein [Pseudanabaena mucicola]|uniref:AAA family ATPase n=1 Tax=Pseudanabaena mucicola FACHB-723 TaxID=2692860 RepID=A0ABR7ZYU9_9CYAN|nr:SbcC/MukB-like Walker B domain-containing protein [Pseudanabaena mucicola]MBD2189107.1 AAA family ATPase [Pseudanabaena mucicola FACHB-723]
MQTSLIEQFDNTSIPTAGFRLQRFEVLNWGTFDQRPWVIDLKGEIGLLTGANGSGKSTLVDGLLTLLVPNRKRNYNQASSSTGKKEREEKSYVQGAYGRTRSEDSYGSKPKILRDKGTISVLLAYFSDRASKQDVTLAEVLWMENTSVRKFFVIADAELAIATHFSQSKNIADLKKYLKANNIEIFDEFSKYSQQFRKRFGFQSEKALDLFNQTVSIKEIGGLNDFVRNHMLEKTDVQTKIRELQESYENLTVSHTAIQKARKQLDALQPITDEAEKYTKFKNEVANLQKLLSIAPAFFAAKKFNLLTQELQAIAQKLTQLQAQRNQSDLRLANLRQDEKTLDFTIKQDTVGQRLQELTREIELSQQEVNRRKKKSEEYNRLTQKLNFPEYSDFDTFHSSRTQGEALKQEIDAVLQTLEAQRDEQKLLQADLQKHKNELEKELQSLRSRKSQIPTNSLDIRDRLAHALNLDSDNLPFIGELLQVRPEAQEWEGAIERLLRNFGLCVLVDDANYQKVNTYVNRTNLRGRLIYYRVTSIVANPMQRAFDPQQIPHKLEIKQENKIFAQWLRDQLGKQFNYVCCDTEEQFQHETRAITQNGLIKHGGEKHEKNDRFAIGDRGQYILGWSNISKINALEAELQQINQKIAQINKQVQLLETQRKQKQEQVSRLQDFMRFVDFAEVDWRSVEAERLNLQKQKQELEASSDQLKRLEAQLKTTQKEILQVEQEKEQLIREIQTLENRQDVYKKDQSQCEMKSQSVLSSELEAFEKYLAKRLREYSMILETISKDENSLKDEFQQKLRQQEQRVSESSNRIEKSMANFVKDFPETTSEMGATLDFLGEYQKLKAQIEQDDLPQHEQRFKQLMNEKVIISISMFKSALEKQEEEIEQAIDELNKSLQTINYTDSTYIKLCCDTSRSREIRDFKEDLKICLGNVARQTAEDNEERFQNIQTRLIERFKAEDRWTSLVTDVRNWLEFSVSERYISDNAEKEHHTDSSGKSGGQKVKLAYTILASAIAYQFGLNQSTGKSRSFRFVVIDEAFSKSDDSNARYAMQLFKNLDLQLLVVTPKDKINVIESYISTIHFVDNKSEGNYSRILPITIEEYQEKRQLALTSKHD